MTSSDTSRPEGEDATPAVPAAAPAKKAARKTVRKTAAPKAATPPDPTGPAPDAPDAAAEVLEPAMVPVSPDAPMPTIGEAPEAAIDQPAARARVIVAEDEALIRLDLVELLRDEGYDVVAQAADGEVAVEKARELRPDLVVMDVQMPRMDGISAATIIAAERIAPVVMLTAFSQRELVERAREAGAMAYVVKPFEASDVVPAIEMAMARFQEIRAVEAEVEDLEERLASRKAVDQAKGLLQTGMGMTEQEAFRWIQKTAMDLRKPMREVAEGVISHAKKPKS